MRVVFRVDASDVLGTGHLMRCLALARGLRERGAHCDFILRPAVGDRRDVIEHWGFPVHLLVGIDTDASSTLALLAGFGDIDWIVVDHYGLDGRWEQKVRSATKRIMVIDDLANRDHDCDLLLDQNLVADMQGRYAARLPASCGQLLGPEYALLPPEYAGLHGRIPPRKGTIHRIVVSFGGASAGRCLSHATRALLDLCSDDVVVEIVAPGGLDDFGGAKRALAGRTNFRVHGWLPGLASLLARADLALSASGGTTWERLCLGLPTVVVTMAENQRPIAEELHRRQLVRWIGDQEDVTAETISAELRPLLEDGLDERWSTRCSALVDGVGVVRVGAAMTVAGTSSLRVRFATPSDEQRILDWANDLLTRTNAFKTDRISAAAHRVWFHSRLREVDDCIFYIVETLDGLSLGIVRFQHERGGWEVHFNLAQPYRGRGLGRPLVQAALHAFDQERPGQSVFGRVKASNVTSRRIFEGLGFTLGENAGGALRYIRRPHSCLVEQERPDADC